MIMGKPIDKKDTDQRTVTEYLRDTNPTAYAAMMRRETVQPSTTLTNVGFVAPDDWLGIKRDIAEDREYMYQTLGQWLPIDKEQNVFDDAYLRSIGRKVDAKGRPFPDEPELRDIVAKIAKTGTQASSCLGSPTTLQNFDAYIKARLREMYPETDGVPPPPLTPNPFLSMIKKEPAPAAGRRYLEPYQIDMSRWKLPPDAKVEKVQIGNAEMNVVADPSLPKYVSFVLGVDYASEPATTAVVRVVAHGGELHAVLDNGERVRLTGTAADPHIEIVEERR